jgi:SAM-dependent methyltransferase
MNKPTHDIQTTTPTGEQIKTCCATAYGSDVVALLLGDSYHPGGLTLTRRLASVLDLAPGERVLDVACGRGTTALLLAQEYGARIDGIDLSPANVALAEGAATASGRSGQVRFRAGDAEHLPYPDSSFDAVTCECALCTFPDKPTAATELARVLRPGGRVGITDVIAEPDRLPAELTTVAAWIACVADARPLDHYARLLVDAGLAVTWSERHDHAITRMLDQIEARLSLVRLTAAAKFAELGLDLHRAEPVLAAARAAVKTGALGYGLLVAAKPAPDASAQGDNSTRVPGLR